MRSFFLTFFLLLSFFSFSQIRITANIIERSDALKEFSDILDVSIGTFVNNDLLFGITNEKSYTDYIYNYHNPVQDSLFVADFQFLVKYYLNKYFLSLKMPIYSSVDDLSAFENARFGAGYIFLSQNNFNFNITYDLLVNNNMNGMRKGRLTLGISADLDFNIPINFLSLF